MTRFIYIYIYNTGIPEMDIKSAYRCQAALLNVLNKYIKTVVKDQNTYRTKKKRFWRNPRKVLNNLNRIK